MLAALGSIAPYLKFLTNKYVIGAILIIMIYFTYRSMSLAIEDLENKTAIQTETIKQQVDTIESLKKDYNDIIKKRDEYKHEAEKLGEDKRLLEEKLYRENRGKKSLEELAVKKSTLIEKKINSATDNVLNCFERISHGEDC